MCKYLSSSNYEKSWGKCVWSLGSINLFLSLYWTPLMQRILAKSVKIPAEVKTGFISSVCPLSVASTARAKLVLQTHIWKGAFSMEPPWLDCARNPCWMWCRNAWVVGWLLQWFLLWSSSLFPLGLPKKRHFLFKPLFPLNPSLVSWWTTNHIHIISTGMKDFL